jgi:hypothetical protein
LEFSFAFALFSLDIGMRQAYHPHMPGYSRITVHLERQQIETLQEVATSTGVPVSALVRNAVTQFLRKRSIPLFLPHNADGVSKILLD